MAKTLLFASTEKNLPATVHTKEGEVRGMKVEAMSQCPERAKLLVGEFESACEDRGFQAAAAVMFEGVALAQKDGCAVIMRVLNHS